MAAGPLVKIEPPRSSRREEKREIVKPADTRDMVEAT